MKLKLDDQGHVVVQDGKPVYVHDDGKEVAFDAPGTVSTISRLNGEAKSNRERAEAAEQALKGFEGITDPAAALKALSTVKNLDDKRLVDAGEVETVKAEAIKAIEDRYAPMVKENETLKGQLNSHLIGGAFASSKFIAEKFAAEGPAGVEIARALFGNSLKVEDGKVVGYDAQGNKLYSRARPGELASAEEAIELLVDSYPHKNSILKGSGANGGGAGHGGGNGGGKKTMSREQFNQVDPAMRAQFLKEGGTLTE
ncbi:MULTISPECIES: DUF6651 domain-containing protein [Pseudomonas aeruginosa group]|uniref:DUF6651 domain-containing protein n=1 Tax=Pseudomonas aeruginosa group TaxID=136841 RepID=UPI001F244214|nr:MULTISPECIES: DUF6651 domain-containing protein [Pseudomonas aeruginosa group]MDG9855583.1 hypothetical protein [Pseudomonas nitroreducens]